MRFLDGLIKYSLRHRLSVLVLGLIALVYGSWVALDLPVDVFPDLNRPVVTVLTEGHGLAPEEVETLITVPIESVFAGLPGVVRVRSSSGIGISIIYVEFEWGTDIYRNRQLVAERLRLAEDLLPEGKVPIMGPITSIMGEIQFVGLVPEEGADPMEARTLADWVLRPRLMSIPGVSQVVVMGGQVKQYQILVSTEKLQKKGLSLEDLERSLRSISENTTGGFLNKDGKEFLIRPLGRIENIEELENSFIATHFGKPVRIKDVAKVQIGPQVKRGEASISGEHAVVLTIQKQPEASTIELTKRIEEELEDFQKTLQPDIRLETDLFKQSHFIENSISNVIEALRDGAIMVALVLLFFLLNIRTTAITLTAIPLSFVITAIVFSWLGLGVNTMTLGGLAIAIGELVDDAIIDVENIFRRLKQNRFLPNPKPILKVCFEASREIRSSVVYSTIIVVLVFVPLFALSGIEGRLFKPLGLAYIISLLASLLVSLTITPVLCSYLLPNIKATKTKEDPLLIQWIKKFGSRLVGFTLNWPKSVITSSALLLAGSIYLIPFMGQNFLPQFNEGTAVLGVASYPGISLPESDKLGTKIEKALLTVPEVKSTVRRTGRAEMDEHAEGVHWSEIDVDFHEGDRPKEVVLEHVRRVVNEAGDVYVNVGQPISHRLDHMMSGVRSQIAIKVFGSDLAELRSIAGQIYDSLEGIDGLVDLSVEPLVRTPQLKIAIYRDDAAEQLISAGALAEDLELALNGARVAQVLEGQKTFDIFVRLDEESRASPEKIEETVIKIMPTGRAVKLGEVAAVYEGDGPNMVNREDRLRRIVVQANSAGRDLASLMQEIQQTIETKIELPQNYFIKYGGQYESQQQAQKLILILGMISLLAILFVLFLQFRSTILSLQIMLNVPFALIGSIIAIYITEREFSLASLVAFITLCGIATRNGILMINHYITLMKDEGESFSKEMVTRGSLERLIPVLMTALTAVFALSPLLFAKGDPGKEILYPVAVVIVGGLISSTLLVIFVTPTIFYNYGRRAAESLVTLRNEKEKGELEI